MSQKFREVKRKANVGERVRIVDLRSGATDYGKGDEFIVKEVDERGSVEFNDKAGDNNYADAYEYVVLEPFEEPVASTYVEMSELFAQFIRDNAGTVRKYLDEIETVAEEPQLKPLTRAEVIAKAKADVAELERIGSDVEARLPDESPIRSKFYRVEYHVNRDKRAVTALVKKRRGSGIWAKATAKASPDDVFNADIGKAIALRRALGLAVPDEYINAPQPEKALVGSYVIYEGYRVNVRPQTERFFLYMEGTCSENSVCSNDGKLIDDTDVDYEEVTA